MSFFHDAACVVPTFGISERIVVQGGLRTICLPSLGSNHGLLKNRIEPTLKLVGFPRMRPCMPKVKREKEEDQ